MDAEDVGLSEGQRSIYGASLKRKRIDFIPATGDVEPEQPQKPFRSVGDRYLSIVLKDGILLEDNVIEDHPKSDERAVANSNNSRMEQSAICEICNLPIQNDDNSTAIASSTERHDLSLAHQVCLEHSYPPSHLDRNRQGLKYLSSYGWDPDARVGLGLAGEGIRAPVKAREKRDTVGLGMLIPERKKAPSPVMLDAGEVRKRDKLERKRMQKLQETFYQSEEIEKYLGQS